MFPDGVEPRDFEDGRRGREEAYGKWVYKDMLWRCVELPDVLIFSGNSDVGKEIHLLLTRW